MDRLKIIIPVFALTCCLFANDFTSRMLTSDIRFVIAENSEEKESSEKKDKEQTESDESKFQALSNSSVNRILSFTALAIVSERKYYAPSYEVLSPPPERA